MTGVGARAALGGIALGAALGAAMVACARPLDPMPGWQQAQAKRNEITALWTQIRDWRRAGRMEVEPEPAAVVAMHAQSVGAAAAVCPDGHEPSPTCSDVCELGDAICDNAESICAIAADLGNDPWAKEKCDSAKASCREAKERCCACDHHAGLVP